MTVEDDHVFGSEDRHAAAGADGALHRKVPGFGVDCHPLVTSEGIVVATLAGTYQFTAGDGHELWRATTGADLCATAAGSGTIRGR